MSLELLQDEEKTLLFQEKNRLYNFIWKNRDSAKAQRLIIAEMRCANVAQSLPLWKPLPSH